MWAVRAEYREFFSFIFASIQSAEFFLSSFTIAAAAAGWFRSFQHELRWSAHLRERTKKLHTHTSSRRRRKKRGEAVLNSSNCYRNRWLCSIPFPSAAASWPSPYYYYYYYYLLILYNLIRRAPSAACRCRRLPCPRPELMEYWTTRPTNVTIDPRRPIQIEIRFNSPWCILETGLEQSFWFAHSIHSFIHFFVNSLSRRRVYQRL